jgi:arylsulfatase
MLVFVAFLASVSAALAAGPPNIVVVLIDDVGFSDIGCYGSEIPTPNLDQLAANGVRFTQFYNTARCSPTRASLITGLYPHQAGMGWLDGKVEPQSRGFHGKLLPRCVTIAEVLRDAGYFTAMTGKWHLGQGNGTPPWKRGFMRSLNSIYGEVYFPKEKGGPGTQNLYLNGREIPKDSPEIGQGDWYSTDLFTEWGLKFIDEARAEKKPFFLYLAQGAAHFPLRAPEEIIARYRGKYMAGWDQLREQRYAKQKQLGIIDPKWPLALRPADSPAWDTRAGDRKKRFDEMMAVYAAMIDRIDFAVGTLVAGLRERGELDNTLILFLSDNGGNAEGGPPGTTDDAPIGSPQSHVQLGMNWATLCNTPFARYKHFTHEGGISTPLIAHWPAGIKTETGGQGAGRLCREPAHLIDIMATCVDVAGAKYPREFNGHAIEPMEGVSLRPAFTSPSLPLSSSPRLLFWEHEGNKAVRDGQWKLVMRHRLPWQLFDMEADRTEQHDVIGEHPEIASRLEAAWNAWALRTYVDEWNGPDHTDWGHDIKRAAQ